MPDANFADPRLARLYDAFDGERDDLPAYLGLSAELGARRVLDVGCGTGSLALVLAGRGYEVVAADPAEASLDVARGKPGADAVTWLHTDAASLPPLDADLAIMSGNVAQVFLSDEEWSAALRGVHAALHAGGHCAFETRRPEDRAWERWALDTAPAFRDVAGVGRVEQWRHVTEVDLPLVSFRHGYRFPDGSVVTSESTLRFRDRLEVERDLAAHGFATTDVRETPDRPGREYVFVARRR